MAKKGTTGGPRARRTTSEDIKRRQEYRSRSERERMWQRRALIITLSLVAVSVVVLLASIVYEQVIVPRQAVTKVDDVSVTTSEFQERVRYTRWLTADQIRNLYYQLSAFAGGDPDTLNSYLSQYAGTQISQLQNPVLMGSTVLDEMEEEILLSQAARDMGIEVDQEAVDQSVDEYMASLVGLSLPADPNATPTTEPTPSVTPLVSPTPRPTNTPTLTPTPAPTEEDATPAPTATEMATLAPTATLQESEIEATITSIYDDFTDSATDVADVDEEVIRDLFYYEALRSAIRDEVTTDVPAEQLQVNARHILIAFNPDNPSDVTPPTDEQKAAAEALANEAVAALQDGEPFADLAKAVSNDTGSASNGGQLGWADPESYDPAFADATLNAELGEIVGPIESTYGYHIIQVLGREVRPLTDSEYQAARDEAFTAWLNELKAAADIERNDNWMDRVPETPTFNELLGDILVG